MREYLNNPATKNGKEKEEEIVNFTQKRE